MYINSAINKQMYANYFELQSQKVATEVAKNEKLNLSKDQVDLFEDVLSDVLESTMNSEDYIYQNMLSNRYLNQNSTISNDYCGLNYPQVTNPLFINGMSKLMQFSGFNGLSSYGLTMNTQPSLLNYLNGGKNPYSLYNLF